MPGQKRTKSKSEASFVGITPQAKSEASEAAILTSPIRLISSVARIYRVQRPWCGTKTAQHRLDRRLELDRTAGSCGDGARLF